MKKLKVNNKNYLKLDKMENSPENYHCLQPNNKKGHTVATKEIMSSKWNFLVLA